MCMVMKKRGYIVRLEDAISVTPYIRSVAENVRGIRGCEDREPMPPCVWKTLSPYPCTYVA